MDPSTGEGFEAVEVGQDKYFDPNASGDSWPGVTGLWMISHHWWQGDVAFDTYEEVGPDANLSVVTTPADPTATAIAPILLPGAAPDFTVNGMIPQVCEEDGVFDLIGQDSRGVTIVLQGAYIAEGTIGDLFFPVPPEELSADFPTDNDWDTDVVGLGEITIPGPMKLESIGWASFFPRDWDPGYCTVDENLMMAPMDAITALIWTKRFRLPCKLIIGDTPWNEDVIIKTLKWTVKAGEPGDIYYDIQFKRYRTVSIATVVTPDAPVDPRDYPTYQGPPSIPYVPPMYAQGHDVWYNDGTQTNAVAPDPKPGDPGYVVKPSAPVDLNGAKDYTEIVDGKWVVGQSFSGTLAVNQLLGGESMNDIYEQIKLTSDADLNPLNLLITWNANQPVKIYWNFTAQATSPPPPDKTRVGEYAINEPLPVGTEIIYKKRVKPQATAQKTIPGSGGPPKRGITPRKPMNQLDFTPALEGQPSP